MDRSGDFPRRDTTGADKELKDAGQPWNDEQACERVLIAHQLHVDQIQDFQIIVMVATLMSYALLPECPG